MLRLGETPEREYFRAVSVVHPCEAFLSYRTNLEKIYYGFFIESIFVAWNESDHPWYILKFTRKG